jgi:two-component system, sensor histidine kinase and response regulator
MKILRVLLVDDDPIFRAEAEAVLTRAKFSVKAVDRYDKAETVLRRFKGRVVVLAEQSVAGRSAIDFLQETLRLYPHTPFTLVARSPSLEGVIEALKQGAYDFLRKPVDPDILVHSVARSVEKLNLSVESEKQEREIRLLLSRSRQELTQVSGISEFKSFLLSTVAHDFRAILTVLDGYHQAIKEGCAGCEVKEQLELHEQAQRSVTRLRTMAATLLDFDAAERGELRLATRSFDLSSMLVECISFYRPYAEQKRVRLDLDGLLPRMRAKADPDRVMQVLDNILYNSIKFTPADGEIRVGGREEDGRCSTVWVRDTGEGIPKEIERKILRGEAPDARYDGSARLGLGLSICRKLIEAQNGKIWLESLPGEGTQVFFSLPS